MKEIKVGEYVRTKKGDIHKVIGIREELRNGKRVYSHKAYFLDSKKGSLTPAFIAKHSPNIIDLIEVGDYVNGYIVESLDDEYGNEILGFYRYDDDVIIGIIPLEGVVIDNVVTKEQFKNVMYEVK